MPTIDGVKMACQQCITGHRTSRCTHSSRDLIEIKKKGRPFSQCANCSDLRKNGAAHGRCDCEKKNKASKKLCVESAMEDSSDLGVPSAVGVQRPVASSSKLTKVTSSCCKTTPPARSVTKLPLLTHSSLTTAPPHPLPTDSSPIYYTPSDYPYTNIPPFDAIQQIHLTQEISKQGSSALFLPSTTVGTHDCFCGESCSCVGCAQHDPLGKKGKSSTANGMQHGRTEGGGCGCGTTECVGLDVGINELLRSLTGAGSKSSYEEGTVVDIGGVDGGYDVPIVDPAYRLPPILDATFYNYNLPLNSFPPPSLPANPTPSHHSLSSPYAPLSDSSPCCAETYHDEYSAKEECCEIVCDCTTACGCSSRLQPVA